ncbi:DUF5063 domain-containing protein [Sporolactobacillus shoreicorticis]|uniref:DUF5063 domain-containing protein n=1 Tax=Sporolactobacillus shoreicorticis TaxID=1923877 RepID=A0ABW5S402_9BACL|nr:DUF5063 domain-containing protein [Sporolactobacillus shoreicorticis]MCO7124381.1 DUF5063 domain-containing protein [Sporolactobacillus shoreicorticis]
MSKNMCANQNFFQTAQAFCNFLEQNRCVDELDDYKQLHRQLLILYQAASSLEYSDCDYDGGQETVNLPVIEVKKYDVYWEIFDPYHPDEPLTGSLSDDLSDIYAELKAGMQLYKKNEIDEAAWHWKLGFDSHWGFHLVDALRALHYVISREIDSE